MEVWRACSSCTSVSWLGLSRQFRKRSASLISSRRTARQPIFTKKRNSSPSGRLVLESLIERPELHDGPDHRLQGVRLDWLDEVGRGAQLKGPLVSDRLPGGREHDH